LVVDNNGPTMMARMGVMRALNRRCSLPVLPSVSYLTEGTGRERIQQPQFPRAAQSFDRPEGGGKMTDDDPNEAYDVVPIEPGPKGPPKGWWTVKRNGIPVRHFPGKENAERYATDPEYRASLVTRKAWGK
jgi:hypothetical protein